MKIAYLSSQYPAPSHTFIRREVEALRRRGLEIDTFSIRRPAAHEVISPADQHSRATTWYVLPTSPLNVLRSNLLLFLRRPVAYLRTLAQTLTHRLPGLKGLLWAYFYFLEAMLLAEQLEARQIQHLHNHFANPAANVGLAISRYLGITWSLTLHGPRDFDDPLAMLLAEKVVACRFVACATQFGCSQTMRLTPPSEWPKLFVSRCGLDLKQFPQQPHSGNVPTEESRAASPETSVFTKHRCQILCVARLAPDKGQVGLLQAFALARANGLDADLVLIGGGPDEARIRAAVSEYHLDARVKLLGVQPEAVVFETMLKSDFLVLASFAEGLPVVLMEALFLKLPVIAPLINGIPELIEHERTGLLFIAGDWPQLADRILTMAQNADLRARLAAAGHAKVTAEFNIDHAVIPLYQHFVALSSEVTQTKAAR
ncbi:glycosyltransferase [Trichothermofontia sp.]